MLTKTRLQYLFLRRKTGKVICCYQKKSVCVKHTIIISQDTDGHLISEDEAHYINGVLNSSIVKAYIHSTFKTNGFSLKKSHLYLPKFNPENVIQARIAQL